MRYRLLQARIEGDVVRSEERVAFSKRLGVPVEHIDQLHMVDGNVTYKRATEGVDCVLVGGSGAFGMYADVPWMSEFVDTLGEIARTGFPMFGSCFGFQGMVVALGGSVLPDDDSSEVGTYEVSLQPAGGRDPLFGDLPAKFNAQLGHKDRAFEFPSSLENLIASERCPYQALRVAGKPVYATQFHPELTWEENRMRFSRYFDMYKVAFGDEEAERKMREGFRPSPEANDLLPRFAAMLQAGELG